MKSKTLAVAFFFSIVSIAGAGAQSPKVPDTARVYQAPSVTVTSTRAFEKLSPVPFVNLDYKQIGEKYITQDLPMLLNNLPSVVAYSQNGNGIGYSNLTMRGFDQRRISVMINGIPMNDPEDHDVYWIDFPDLASNLENIQVQRGAGLINYGSAAIGGSINLTTSNFTKRRGILIYSGMGLQEYGAGGNSNVQAITNKESIEYSSGVVDNYAFYGRLSRIYSLGYRDRAWTDLNSFFFSAIRFDKNFTTQFNIFGGPVSDGLAYTGLPKSYIGNANLRRLNPSGWAYDSTGKTIDWYSERRKEEVESFSQPHFEMLNDWQMSDELSMKSAVFYYQGDGYFDYDGSGWADTSLLALTNQFGFNPTANPTDVVIRGYVSNKQGGWIPRIIWTHGASELTMGAELRWHRSEHYGNISYANVLPDNFSPDYKFYSYNGLRDIYSFFARERYEASNRLALSAEFQVVRQRFSIADEKVGGQLFAGNFNYNTYSYTPYLNYNGDTISGSGNLFNIDYIFFNPRLGLTWNATDQVTLYSQLAVTSREPRMRNLYPADDAYFGGAPLFETRTLADGRVEYDFSKPIAKPETMYNAELGGSFRQDALRASINFYWMEYANELIKTGRVDIFGNPVDENADRARHYGVELTGAYDFIRQGENRLGIALNATFSQNTIVRYDLKLPDYGSVSLAGNEIPGFPDFLANIALTGEYEGLYASLDGKYCGRSRTDYYGNMVTTNGQIMSQLKQAGAYYADNTLDPFFVLNANISYTFKDLGLARELRLQLQANNLLDELYAGGAEGPNFFPAAERNIFFGLELGL